MMLLQKRNLSRYHRLFAKHSRKFLLKNQSANWEVQFLLHLPFLLIPDTGISQNLGHAF